MPDREQNRLEDEEPRRLPYVFLKWDGQGHGLDGTFAAAFDPAGTEGSAEEGA